MLNLTLDHNCLINLENRTCEWKAIKELVALHRDGAVRVHIGVISASENVKKKDGAEPSYAVFAAWIERLGLQDLPCVLPEARVGMSYIGHCVLGDEDDPLPARVQDIVHPALSDRQNLTWKNQRNRLCDIDGIVAHIRNRLDVFVTEDADFLDRRDALVGLGAGDVLTPEAAVRLIKSSTSA